MASETTDDKITRIETELGEVRQAIKDAQKSSSLSVFGRSVSRADLATLYSRESQLQNQLDRLYSDGQNKGLKYLRFTS